MSRTRVVRGKKGAARQKVLHLLDKRGHEVGQVVWEFDVLYIKRLTVIVNQVPLIDKDGTRTMANVMVGQVGGECSEDRCEEGPVSWWWHDVLRAMDDLKSGDALTERLFP